MSDSLNAYGCFHSDGTLNTTASNLSREDFASIAQQLAHDIVRRDNSAPSNPALPYTPSAIDDSPTLRVLQQRLHPFDGRRNIRSLDAYLDSLENYFAVASLSGSSQLVIAISYLENTAAIWWKSHIRSTPEDAHGSPHPQRIRNWAMMKKCLLAEFYPTDVIRAARDRLAKLHQTSSVKDYVDRFRNIELEIPDLSESEKVDRFRRGLKDDVRLQVTLHPALRNADFATLVASAVEVDDILFHSQRGKHYTALPPNIGIPENTRSEPEYTPMEIDVVDVRKKTHVRPSHRLPLTAEERTRLVAHKGCFYCRKEYAGHISKDCPSRLSDEIKRSASSSTASGNAEAQ